MTTPTDESVAKRRLLLLTFVRLLGIVCVGAGLVIWNNGSLGGLSAAAGVILIIMGVVNTTLLPRMMVRGWRAQDGRQDGRPS